MAPIEKTKEIIKKLPEHKPKLDFLAAVLTVPVLITVLILNLSNLNKKNLPTTITPTVTQAPSPATSIQTTTKEVPIIIVSSPTPAPTSNPNTCKQEIGPLTIEYPQENQTVSDNTVCININYHGDGYCPVTWSYKLNNGSWSDYSNNSVCISNLQQGQNTFLLQVKSTPTGDTQVFTRHFIYNPANMNTPTPTQSATIPPSSTPVRTQ